MKSKTISLRTQFIYRSFVVLVLIALISGASQIFFMNIQIKDDVEGRATLLSQSIQQGMTETELASESIENQIDLRMESNAKRIADKLNGKSLGDISNNDLYKIKDELALAGITLFARQGDDIIGVKSTAESEIGFSFKKIGYPDGYKALDTLYKNEKVTNGTTYATPNIFALPISQSGSHDKPTFFKFAYYLEPGTDYIISSYIEANEVYQLTKEIGPDAWIDRMKEQNDFITEIAVLDPRVYENPELETKLFPPLKKVVYGEFTLENSEDQKRLKNMAKNGPRKEQYKEKYKNEKVYKILLPASDGKVVFVALDYGAISGPLYRHSMILVISSLVSLLALFLITARFFNTIYEKISLIISQIQKLEDGDLTAKSTIKDGSELEKLSKSANKMVDKLNKLLKDTEEQAVKTQWLSVILEADASQSVEKMYQVSTETTIKAREQQYEITSFLDDLEESLQPYKDNEQVISVIEKIENMKEVAKERTSATTDFTITLSDLLKSLHGQSSELSDISNTLLGKMSKFKL